MHEVSFEVKRTDVFAFQFAHAIRNRALWLFPLLLTVVVSWRGVQEDGLVYNLPFIVLSFLVWTILHLGMLAVISAVMAALAQGPVTLGPRTIALAGSGIRETTEGSTHETSWSAVRKIVQTRTHLFVYFVQSGAYIVPWRVFVSPEDRDAFRSFAARSMHQARVGS